MNVAVIEFKLTTAGRITR